MYKRPDRRQQVSRLALIYTIMTLAVITVVSIMILFVMGYRFDTSEQRFEQTGLVQFDSQPRDSVIEIDQRRISDRTAAKRNLAPGNHEFAIWQEGYETWWKSLDIKAGSLTWLDYAKLIPKERPASVVESYAKLDQTMFSPGGRFLAAWRDESQPTLDILNLQSSDDIKTRVIELSAESLANTSDKDASHRYELIEWDQSGRYVLFTHISGTQLEWLMLDRENPEQLINITSLVGLPIEDAQLAGTDGKLAYIKTEDTIRRVNLETGEISRSLASRVDSFSLYSADVITYVGRVKDDGHQKVVGLVRTDDGAPYILKTIQGANNLLINVSTARYFNQNYVAISIGNTVEIYSGSYPSAQNIDEVETGASSLIKLASLEYERPIEWLQFSGNGRFVVMQDERGFRSYDLERNQASSVVRFESKISQPLQWLDSYHFWTVERGQLVMQDFDGANRHVMNPASDDYSASFDANGGYLYSVVETDKGVNLQRVDMVL